MKTRSIYIMMFITLTLAVMGCDDKKEQKTDDSAVAEAAEKVERKIDRAGDKIAELGQDEKVVDNDAELELSPDVKKALDEIDADIDRMEKKLNNADKRAEAKLDKAVREAKAERAELRAELKEMGNDIDSAATRTRVDIEKDIVALRDRLDKTTDEMFEDESDNG
jgi:sensor domain CHASE-containing protein